MILANMTTPIPRNCMKAIFYILIATVIFSFTGINKAQAFQKKSTDTVSTSDVQFTNIPTAADSITARKKAAQEAAEVKTTASVKVNNPEKHKRFWQIFIAALVADFL